MLPDLGISSVMLVAVAAIAFGLASLVFSEMTAFVEHVSRRIVPHPVW